MQSTVSVCKVHGKFLGSIFVTGQISTQTWCSMMLFKSIACSHTPFIMKSLQLSLKRHSIIYQLLWY